jgi:hypothetical protein
MPLPYEHDLFSVLFDPRLVIEILRSFDAVDELSVSFQDDRRPALFRGPDGSEFIVTPMIRVSA